MNDVVAGITVLLLYQLAGEVIARTLALPVPGPVIGMALLFATLLLRGLPERMKDPAAGLLQHLSLLFVPAGVGIMAHFARVAEEWLAIVLSLVLSTVATLAVTALVVTWLAPGLRRGDDAE